MFDLVLLIDEGRAEVRGAGVNQRFEEACSLAQQGLRVAALAMMRAGREEISEWMVSETRNVAMPTVMVGMPAGVLYQALAGRVYGSNLSEYSSGDLCSIARWARACVLGRLGDSEAWALAWRCIESQGEEIRPWLCTMVVDAAGVPVPDSPLYDTRLLLSGGVWIQ